MYLPEPEPAMEKGQPSASRSRRFSEDQFLRRHDFRIYARPKRGPVKWQHVFSREIMTQVEAVAFVNGLLAELESKGS